MGRLIDADRLKTHFSIELTEDIAPTVDAIPKSDYENRLKADMVAMLMEIQLEIEEIRTEEPIHNGHGISGWEGKWAEDIIQECSKIIQQKINSLKEIKDGIQ